MVSSLFPGCLLLYLHFGTGGDTFKSNNGVRGTQSFLQFIKSDEWGASVGHGCFARYFRVEFEFPPSVLSQKT